MIQAIRNTPRSLQRKATAPTHSATENRDGRMSRIDPAIIPKDAVPATNTKQKRQLQRLKVVRERIEELILLNDRQLCQELVGGLSAAEKVAYRKESQRLVTDVRRLVGSRQPHSETKEFGCLSRESQIEIGETTQVRIRLSSAATRILQAFGRTGKRPGELIERALWNDPDIQDAALLLRIEPPARLVANTTARTGQSPGVES